MTKRELYENAIGIQKRTGQGLSGIVGQMNSDIQDLLDELVEEGNLKLIHQSNNYLPDDYWYFPTKGYCVFDPNEETTYTDSSIHDVRLGEAIDCDVAECQELLRKNRIPRSEIGNIKIIVDIGDLIPF